MINYKIVSLMINLQNYFPFWFSFLLKSNSVPMVGVVVKPSVELCRCMQEKRGERGERENVYGCLELLEARNGYCAGCSLAAACCCIG